MLPPVRVFRLFVSSTFTDLAGERDALHKRVFPLIHQFCADRGARFDPVDLRWGISEEAARDQRTIRVCLDEVQRCLSTTPRPNFLILLSDRYGWKPLPPEVPVDDFVKIRAAAAESHQADILDNLYPEACIDANAVPAVRCLRMRKEESDAVWQNLERAGVEALRAAARNLPFSSFLRAMYGGSATEQEIFYGLLRDEIRSGAREHVHVFLRDRDDAFAQASARLFELVDGVRDREAPQAAESLKAQLRTALPETNIHVYQGRWTGTDLDTSFIGDVVLAQRERAAAAGAGAATSIRQTANLCQDLYEAITGIIEQELRNPQQASGAEAEKAAHKAFAESRGDIRFFTGRDDARSAIADYLDGAMDGCLAVMGPSGSGKSALMARALLDRKQRTGTDVVLSRFIGVTPDSSDGRAILASLSAEIAREYGAPEPPAVADFSQLMSIFTTSLTLASAEKRLILLLDALDQLSEVNHEHELRWLPLRKLPDHVRVVVSVAVDRQIANTVRDRTPNILNLPGMPDFQGDVLLTRWLTDGDSPRTLTPNQRKEVLRGFSKSGGLPLYLRSAFEQARYWRSFDGPRALPADVAGILNQTFAKLADPTNHGELLVCRSMAFLAASREGLTEDEILGLLWKELPKQTDMLSASWKMPMKKDFERRFPNSPRVDKLPRVVWSLLYYDLKPYLTERNANGVPVLSFFHRQMRDTAVSAFLPETERPSVHSILADWFRPAETGDQRAAFDIRSLTELPYQLRGAGMWKELEKTLCDLSFVEAKCAAGLIFDLLADYDAALQSTKLTDEQHRQIAGFAKFVRADSHVLASHPELTMQQAFNEPDKAVVFDFAQKKAENAQRPYFRFINKPQTESACVMTLHGHKGIVNTCEISPDGTKLISGAGGGEIRMWDLATGRLLLAFPKLDASVEFCGFSHDGSRIFSATRDGQIQLWDSGTGDAIKVLPSHGAVPVCRLSTDNRRMICASWDGTVTLWDVDTSSKVRVFPHPLEVYSCAFSKDEKTIVSGAGDGILRIWDAETGAPLHTLEAHGQAIMDCRFSGDGKYLFTASQDGTLKRWLYATRECINTYEGHEAPVWALAVSKNGRRVVSGSQDGSVIFWEAGDENETPRVLARAKEHLGEIWGLALSPDETVVVSASWDLTLKIWSMKAVDEIAKASARESVNAGREGRALWGYMIPCSCSPDGRYYAAASSDGSVRVWDAATGRSLGTFPIHNDYVFACAFSSDAKWVISGCWDGKVKLLELGTWRTVDAPQHKQMVVACGFIEQTTRLFSCSADGVRICDFNDPNVVEESFRRFDEEVTVCVFAPDGQWFIAGLKSGTLVRVESASGKQESLNGRHEDISCCAVSPDGRLAATGSEHGDVKFWDLASGREIARVQLFDVKVVACNFSPDGRQLVTCSWQPGLKIIDVSARPETALVIKGHTDQMQDACFTPDGRRILSTSLDFTLRLWDAAAGGYIGSLLLPADCASVCTFSPDGRIAVTASHRHASRVLNGNSGVLERTLSGHSSTIRACAFSNAGQLVTASSDNTLRIWDALSGETLAELQGHDGPVTSCAFSSDSAFIVSGSWDKTVRLWDTSTGRLRSVLSGHDGWVQFVFALPDGSHVGSCSHDGTVRIWDTTTGSAVRILGGDGGILNAAALSSDGSRIAAGYEDGKLRVWNIASGELAAALTGHTGPVRQCAFSDRVVSASNDGTVRVWGPKWLDAPTVLQGHTQPVLACILADHGQAVVSGAEDGVVRMWDIASGRLTAKYWVGTAVESLSLKPGNETIQTIGVGDRTGNFHLIELHRPAAGSLTASSESFQ